MKKSDETRKKIELAFLRLQKERIIKVDSNRKLSITAVAEEAGISPSTLHNRYPDVVEKIREKLGKKMRNQYDKKDEELKKMKNIIKKLREKIVRLEAEIRQLASENMRLLSENYGN